MARPKHDNPDLFTSGELADSVGISLRNLQLLRDQKMGPFATKDQEGGLYGEDTLAELSMIGGCMAAGYSLTLSPALVTAFLEHNPNHPASRWAFLDHLRPDIVFKGNSWFQRHVILRQMRLNQPINLTGANDQDQTLVIADREYVLHGTKGKPRIRTVVDDDRIDAYGPFALGRMRGLVRGGESSFKQYLTEIPESVATEIEFQEAAKNALALVTVNMSLAVRRAFDKVYELRVAKGGPLWPEGGA